MKEMTHAAAVVNPLSTVYEDDDPVQNYVPYTTSIETVPTTTTTTSMEPDLMGNKAIFGSDNASSIVHEVDFNRPRGDTINTSSPLPLQGAPVVVTMDPGYIDVVSRASQASIAPFVPSTASTNDD